jgi:hypothetical protein
VVIESMEEGSLYIHGGQGPWQGCLAECYERLGARTLGPRMAGYAVVLPRQDHGITGSDGAPRIPVIPDGSSGIIGSVMVS